jgi:hypothetical protein
MVKPVRPAATKPARTDTPLLLAGGGRVADVAVASACPQSVPPPLDHQLCHAAIATGFKIPSHVLPQNPNPSGQRD